MSRFDGRKDAQQHDDVELERESPTLLSRCVAHGCPLPGVFSDSMIGGGPWKCFLHEQVEASAWQAVTQLIREKQWITALMQAVAVEQGERWASRATNACSEAQRQDLAPSEGMRPIDYLAFLRAALRRECLPPSVLNRAKQSGEARGLSSAWKEVRRLLPNERSGNER